jgi:hypothetical protein
MKWRDATNMLLDIVARPSAERLLLCVLARCDLFDGSMAACQHFKIQCCVFAHC